MLDERRKYDWNPYTLSGPPLYKNMNDTTKLPGVIYCDHKNPVGNCGWCDTLAKLKDRDSRLKAIGELLDKEYVGNDDDAVFITEVRKHLPDPPKPKRTAEDKVFLMGEVLEEFRLEISEIKRAMKEALSDD